MLFRSYSQTLNINGTASAKANSWDVHFANLSDAKLTGEAKEITKPMINTKDTNIGDFSVVLSKPGSGIEYTFDIVNDGSFFAGLEDVIINTPKCTGVGENATKDAENVCKYVTYSVYFENDAASDAFPMYYQSSWGEHAAVYYCNKSSILNPKDKTNDEFGVERISGHIKIFYGRQNFWEDIPDEELPKNEVFISNLGAQITFRQVDKTCTKPSDYVGGATGSVDTDWGTMECPWC